MKDRPRPEGYVVTLLVTSFPEAQTIVALLESHGIRARLSSDDAGGMRPSLGFAEGYGVLVFEDDVDAAREILESPAPPPPVQ